VKERIAEHPERIEGILGAAGATPPAAKIANNLVHINKTFAADRLEDILAALEADSSDWAETELATLRSKSPQACKVSLRLLSDGARMNDFADEMRQEYAVAARVVQRPDFAEGVRAVLIDKDNAPRWNPAEPEGVTDHMIDTIFAPMPAGEEWTPLSVDGAK
jgi:enoyl-CoA hydratase